MYFRCTLFIWSILTFFAGNGIAQTDSVYSRMILGSAGHKTIFGDPDQYASTQEEIIQRLKSTELAERAVYKSFEKQPAQPERETVVEYAKKCVASLSVRMRSGDTAVLALANPNLVGLVPEKYLDNLMFVLIEYNVEFSRDINQRELDSLDKLLDASYLQLMNARDTLNSFCNTAQFRAATFLLLYQLLDTVAVMKKQLLAMGYAEQDITMMFYQLDTAMHRLKLGYADMLADRWEPKFAGVGVAVYECEYILSMLRCNINAMITIFGDPGNYPLLSQSERGLLYPALHGILTGDLVAHFYKYSYVESRTPVEGLEFTAAQRQYRICSHAYRELLDIRTTTLMRRSTIFPRAYILCIASKVKC